MATKEGMKMWAIAMLTPDNTTSPAIIQTYVKSLPMSDHSALVNAVGSINNLSTESIGVLRRVSSKLSENYHTDIEVSRQP